MLTELDRAEEYANSFIELYEKRRKYHLLWNPSIIDPDFIWEDKDFQEMVIQHIRIKGYRVIRVYDVDGLVLRLID